MLDGFHFFSTTSGQSLYIVVFSDWSHDLHVTCFSQLMERVRNRAAWERQQAQVKRKEEEEAERERSEWEGRVEEECE